MATVSATRAIRTTTMTACTIPTTAPGLARGVSELPGVVGPGLRLTRSVDATQLEWKRTPQGHVSHVYRGFLEAGGLWDPISLCVDYANPETRSVQPEVPPTGALYWFVISAANRCGEGPLSAGTDGSPRQVATSCPIALGDFDTDGRADREDHCPLTADRSLSDGDGDFVGDVCDNCPAVPNPDQTDDDDNDIGDVCELP